jgi:hypothetical protein
MRVVRLVVALLFAVSSSPNLNSQEAVSAQRDVQALAVLGQALAAAGWRAGALPVAVAASGTLTRPDGQQTESFALKQRGPAQHRLDVVSGGATTTTVVNGLAGIVIFADGTKHRLPPHAAFSAQFPVFPFFTDLVKANDLSVDIQGLGADTIDGVAVRGISITRHAQSDDKLAQFRDLAAPLRVWISVDSGLPVRIDFIRLADDNPYLPMHFSISFFDYRRINGVAIAFTQQEFFEGQLIYRVQFSDVQFNSALTDADFDNSKL